MVFSPSFPDRLFHSVVGGWCSGAFLVVSVSAWYLLKHKHLEFARASLKVGLIVALVSSLLQGFLGDLSGKNVAVHQPAKLAAFEGLYETVSNAPLVVIGFVDEKNERTVGIKAPYMLSFLAHSDFHSQVTGLDAFPPQDRPPVTACFLFFHGMVALGSAMVVVAALGFLYFRHGSLHERRWLLWLLVISVVAPVLANELGWFLAEVGRQPWIVYGLLRTPEGLSAVVKANAILTSLILFTFIYILLFLVFIYLLNDKIHHGPDDEDLTPTGKLALPEPLVHELNKPK